MIPIHFQRWNETQHRHWVDAFLVQVVGDTKSSDGVRFIVALADDGDGGRQGPGMKIITTRAAHELRLRRQRIPLLEGDNGDQ